MPVYSVVLLPTPRSGPPETLLVSGDDVTVDTDGAWAVFREAGRPSLLLPAHLVHSITLVTDPEEAPPTGQTTSEPAPGS